MTDFIVQVRVKNGHLLRAIRQKFGTSAAMARATGITQTVLAALLTMRMSPLLATGEWTKGAYDLSSALGIEPEFLWPGHLARAKLRRNECEFEVAMDDLALIVGPDKYAGAMVALSKWARNVPERRLIALVASSQGATMDEAAAVVGGITRARARELAAGAARGIKKAAWRDGVQDLSDMEVRT